MAGLLALAALVFLGIQILTAALVLERLRLPRRAPRATPKVTLLRPVCGLDPFDERTLASSFRQDYPDFELIFCVQDAGDPVVPVVRALIAAHPEVDARLLIGDDPISANPKLNNLWKGWNAARADWICMADSNLELPRDYLATVMAYWGEDTGLVSSPPVGIEPEGWGGRLECAFLNGNQARLQLASDSLGLGFAQGKTMLFNRPLLEQAGGYLALGRHMAEDATATRLIRGIGRRVVLTPRPFAQPIGFRTLHQVWSRQLRWSRVRRDAFPLLFFFEIVNGAALPAALAAGAVVAADASLAWLPGYLAVWYLAEAHVMRRAGWPAEWRDLVMLPLRDMMLPALWIATFARRGFEWRGTAMGAATAAQQPVSAEIAAQ